MSKELKRGISAEDLYSLTRREREILSSIAMAPIPYNEGRNWPSEYRALLSRGLIFHGMNRISITEKGREVEERVS